MLFKSVRIHLPCGRKTYPLYKQIQGQCWRIELYTKDCHVCKCLEAWLRVIGVVNCARILFEKGIENARRPLTRCHVWNFSWYKQLSTNAIKLINLLWGRNLFYTSICIRLIMVGAINSSFSWIRRRVLFYSVLIRHTSINIMVLVFHRSRWMEQLHFTIRMIWFRAHGWLFPKW